MTDPAAERLPFDPHTLTRPEPVLWTYYMITAFLTIVAWPIVLPIHYARYKTLKYTFDDEGISMAWGLLFKREINLTYRRIQDIHVTRNLIQRWLGLATVAIQTASASSSPEMKIEGFTCADELRDYLYSKMRGAQEDNAEPDEHDTCASAPADEALVLLREIRALLAGEQAPTGAHEQSS